MRTDAASAEPMNANGPVSETMTLISNGSAARPGVTCSGTTSSGDGDECENGGA